MLLRSNRVSLQDQENNVMIGKQVQSIGSRRPGADLTNLKQENEVGKRQHNSNNNIINSNNNIGGVETAILATSKPLSTSNLNNVSQISTNEKYIHRPVFGSDTENEVQMIDTVMALDENEISDYEDIDIGDHDDPQSVTAYVEDVYAYCREKERIVCVTQEYMHLQKEIDARMRAILIDWMIDVHLKFKLLPETIYLAVNLIDKFLKDNSISRENLQLLGIACMFIASKYEEIYPPECNDFVFICASAYTREQILDMEKIILNSLGFRLTVPSSLHFLRRFSKAARSDYRTHTLCKYLIELALVDYSMITYLPSVVAASAVYLARIMTNGTPNWNSTLQYYTKYSESNILTCARQLLSVLLETRQGNGNLQAAYRKYSSRKFDEVAKITPPQSI